MSDMVEDVKRAIWVHRCRQEVGEPICDVNDIDPSYDWEGTANVAIAAATPHIRAAVFDELVQWAEDGSVTFSGYGHDGDAADCFREHKAIQ